MSDKWKHDNWHMDECNRHKCGAKEIEYGVTGIRTHDRKSPRLRRLSDELLDPRKDKNYG